MGFPVPINNWSRTHLKNLFVDSLSASRSQSRPYINYQPLTQIQTDQYSRKIWALLNLELWFQNFLINIIITRSYYMNQKFLIMNCLKIKTNVI